MTISSLSWRGGRGGREGGREGGRKAKNKWRDYPLVHASTVGPTSNAFCFCKPTGNRHWFQSLAVQEMVYGQLSHLYQDVVEEKAFPGPIHPCDRNHLYGGLHLHRCTAQASEQHQDVIQTREQIALVSLRSLPASPYTRQVEALASPWRGTPAPRSSP
jgi:hypothetical protein